MVNVQLPLAVGAGGGSEVVGIEVVPGLLGATGVVVSADGSGGGGLPGGETLPFVLGFGATGLGSTGPEPSGPGPPGFEVTGLELAGPEVTEGAIGAAGPDEVAAGAPELSEPPHATITRGASTKGAVAKVAEAMNMGRRCKWLSLSKQSKTAVCGHALASRYPGEPRARQFRPISRGPEVLRWPAERVTQPFWLRS